MKLNKAERNVLMIPAGRFNLNRKVGIDASDMKISGAGIWHTPTAFYKVTKLVGGGFDFLHQDNHVEFSDVYLSSNLSFTLW